MVQFVPSVTDLSTITQPTVVGSNVLTEYFMVYGTLRVGQGNFNYHLKGKAEYIETCRLKGFKYYGGLAAGYTGNPDDSLVVDLFRAFPDDLLEVNTSIDSLEGVRGEEYTDIRECGFYTTCLVPLTLESGEEVVAKFYHVPARKDWYKETPFTDDYLMTSERVFSAAVNYAKFKHYTKFLEFYSSEIASKDVTVQNLK